MKALLVWWIGISTVVLFKGWVECAIDDTEGNIYWHDQPRRDSQEVRYGWRLVILPPPGNVANTLVKRIDEVLNLTCTAEYFDDVTTNVTSDLKQDQRFKLTWHLPIMPQNSMNRVRFVDSDNSKHLTVAHLKESDAGEYECQAKALNDAEYSVAFTESVTIRVKPKKGSCNEPSFLCSSGECIAKRFLCDGMVDCRDKSDEGYDQCGTYHPCDGKLKCDDGRCISAHSCCDRSVDKNCSTWFMPSCCRQLKQIQLSLDMNQYPPQPHHYNAMGFVQTTIYTVIGCAMAFMFIITIMVIAICRVHLKRTAISHPQMRPPAQDSFGNIFLNSGLPYTSAIFNINNGVQLMGRPLHPPPYSELVRIPPREGPPPPYSSFENLAVDSSPSTTPNPGQTNNSTVITRYPNPSTSPSDRQSRLRGRDVESTVDSEGGIAEPLLSQQGQNESNSVPGLEGPSTINDEGVLRQHTGITEESSSL